MTTLDDTFLPLTANLISSFGKSLTFVVATDSYDPATGSNTVSESTSVVKGVLSAYSSRFIDGDLIQNGDLKALIAAQGLTFTPTVGQRVEFNSQKWRIVAIASLYSGDEIAGYRLQLRR